MTAGKRPAVTLRLVGAPRGADRDTGAGVEPRPFGRAPRYPDTVVPFLPPPGPVRRSTLAPLSLDTSDGGAVLLLVVVPRQGPLAAYVDPPQEGAARVVVVVELAAPF